MSSELIDFHTHAWPEKVSGRAQESLEALFKIKFQAPPTLTSLEASMSRCGISKSVICAVATKPEQVPSINDWLFSVRSGKLRVYCAMHPLYAGWKAELSRISLRGDGVKFQPEFQDFFVDDPKMFPVYEEMERLGIPALFHCGEELSGTMQVRSAPERILKVSRKFPGMPLIAAHFGGFQHWEETREFLLGTPVYLDTSFFVQWVPAGQARELLLGHRKDRLLFGSDFPLADPARDIEVIKGLGLGKEVEDALFFRNARLLLGEQDN